MKKLTREEFNKIKRETSDHLLQGRKKLALDGAKKLYRASPNDGTVVMLLAWAVLENGDPSNAMELANTAIELEDSPMNRLYRGYILSRMNIFDGAIKELDFALQKQKEIITWSMLNKARSLAGLGKFTEAINLVENYKPHSHYKKDWEECVELLDIASIITDEKTEFEVSDLIDLCGDAFISKDYWFILYTTKILIANIKKKKNRQRAQVLRLKAMLMTYQYFPAFKEAKELKSEFKNNEEFESIYNKLEDLINGEYEVSIDEIAEEPQEFVVDEEEINLPAEEDKDIPAFRTGAIFFPNEFADIFAAKTFDAGLDKSKGKRVYYQVFEEKNLRHVGVELVFNNPFYQIEDKEYKCTSVWYLNDFEIGRNDFLLDVNQSWDAVIFAQTWGSDEVHAWARGQGKVEIYMGGFKICDKWFGIGDNAILLEPEEEKKVEKPVFSQMEEGETEKSFEKTNEMILPSEESIDDVLAELDKFIGLGTIKKSVRDFMTYLEFIQQRKKKGLKVDETISLHSVFIGNPGTGKTTIARLMGRLFRAMNVLPKGHVVEVDRSGLVGQYVGETAQKAEKVIEEAMGGVLFIDEAYTLVKKGGGGQDFGQEAVDILLKRMEDDRGKFIVIAAGYTEEMETFLTSNPGLKSRFTRRFEFEDYMPEELMEIFEMLMKNEEYSIADDAKEFLLKEFTKLYRNRDKNFGNARLVRILFEEAKLELSRRFTQLETDDQTTEAMTTIILEDIQNILAEKDHKEAKISIDEEQLKVALEKLNSLIGLERAAKEISDLVKLARYYAEEGEDLKSKFCNHYLFLGNPGTGKTTVARIFGQIFSSLGILPKGHLVEVDKQGLVASYVGQTAQKTSEAIDKALGGTLFIDEAYTLISAKGSSNDFGKEAIDTLLKRMEDDRGKFIVIAAGYTEEMRSFIESNPGIQSRFTKTIHFDDYTPDNLLEISERILAAEDLKLTKEVKKGLHKYFTEIYRNRDKNFGNARIVRNLMDAAKQRRLIRLAEMDHEERSKEENKALKLEDFEVLQKETTKAKKYEISTDPEGLKKVMDELNSLKGLKAVKDGVEKLINGLKVAKLRKERGLQVIEKPLHSVFLGNPGTGKTTVARLMSKVYKELGMLERGHLVEVDRADLVAGYQGQTASKTEEVIKRSLGGTLFIDEAYTLARGGNDFGQEAIDTLLKRMEDHKGEFVVIVAGYTNEMDAFLASNPGLNSRFPNKFLFEDYSPRELLDIAWNIAEKNGYILDEGALQLLLELFDELYENRDKNFGNARTARNILYSAIANQEERLALAADLTKEELMTIVYDDVDKVKESL